MDSANRDNMAAGILRLLTRSMPRTMVVHHFIFGGDISDLFSGEVGGGVPPASKAAIASLKEVQGAGGEGDSLGDCAICLDAFGAGKEMPCGHRFHGECLERWLGVHGNCPVCRHELPKAEPAAEEQQQSGDGERRGPRSAFVVSIMMPVGGAARPREEEQREEPINIRIEDVD